LIMRLGPPEPDAGDGPTLTPIISRVLLSGRRSGLAARKTGFIDQAAE
jgi:hypothetical protein